jgi:DNA-damage-inducible protein J
MLEQELINISLESDIKTVAEEIFKQFGMTKSEAVELFYHQVAITRNIPFAQRSFNENTVKAIKEVKEKHNLTTYENFAELRRDLEV